MSTSIVGGRSPRRFSLTDPATGKARWTVPSGPLDLDTAPVVIGDNLVTVEGGTMATPDVTVVSRRIADGATTTSVNLGPLAALGVVLGTNHAVIVRVAAGSGMRLIDVAGRGAWNVALPNTANRDPVALPGGGAAIQVATPPVACGF